MAVECKLEIDRSFKRQMVVCEFEPRKGDFIYLPDDDGSLVEVVAVCHSAQMSMSSDLPSVLYQCERVRK